MIETLSVLFVDDEPAIVKVLGRLVRQVRPKWRCVVVTSGEEALAAVAKESFDVIVSDIRMAPMDGAELLARLTSLAPTMGRIALSGHADRETYEGVLRVAHAFLSKPSTRDEILATIERIAAIPAEERVVAGER
ncbi:MAG: response regulator [Polyangiaceae bacterium]